MDRELADSLEKGWVPGVLSERQLLELIEAGVLANARESAVKGSAQGISTWEARASNSHAALSSPGVRATCTD